MSDKELFNLDIKRDIVGIHVTVKSAALHKYFMQIKNEGTNIRMLDDHMFIDDRARLGNSFNNAYWEARPQYLFDGTYPRLDFLFDTRLDKGFTYLIPITQTSEQIETYRSKVKQAIINLFRDRIQEVSMSLTILQREVVG